MITPVLFYSSGGNPIGPQGAIAAKIQFYRPPAALDSAGIDYVAGIGPAFGSEATGTAVGSPIIVSKAGVDLNSAVHRTTGRYGQSNNDPYLLRGEPTLNLSTFITASGVASLMPGDYISVIIGWAITSTPATPVAAKASRWVIDGNSLATTGPNEWNMKLVFDRPNSDPAFNLF